MIEGEGGVGGGNSWPKSSWTSSQIGVNKGLNGHTYTWIRMGGGEFNGHTYSLIKRGEGE